MEVFPINLPEFLLIFTTESHFECGYPLQLLFQVLHRRISACQAYLFHARKLSVSFTKSFNLSLYLGGDLRRWSLTEPESRLG